MEKAIGLILRSSLFKRKALYPKRFYDDVIMEESLMMNGSMSMAG
jgi:hypothetical protein